MREIVELDFYQMFQEGFVKLENDGEIVNFSTKECADYRLVSNGKTILNSGEPCEVVFENDKIVSVETIESEERYTFTALEFEIGTM